jgi:uncharacterized protein
MLIAITGAGGLVGTRLAHDLEQDGHQVRRLSRSAGPGRWVWPGNRSDDATVFAGVDAVVHLAGESLAGWWTTARKQRIRQSRVEGTRRLVEALTRLVHRPRLISTSAVGFYGDRGEESLTEHSPAGTGFLAEVATEWESEANRYPAEGGSVAIGRLGVVLAEQGGMLAALRWVFGVGLGAKLGSGQQFMPWISLADASAAFRFLLADPPRTGVWNFTAGSVRNAEFTKAFAQALSRPTLGFAPTWLLRLAMGEQANEMLLASQQVHAERLTNAGFRFQHPELTPFLIEAFAR